MKDKEKILKIDRKTYLTYGAKTIRMTANLSSKPWKPEGIEAIFFRC